MEVARKEGWPHLLTEIVLLDLGLPELDGYEVAHRLRHRQRPEFVGLRIVALTGYG